jgi:hypothetical protein
MSERRSRRGGGEIVKAKSIETIVEILAKLVGSLSTQTRSRLSHFAQAG